MKIAAYVQLHRSNNTPTGVGQHLIHMVRSLWGAEGVEMSILASRRYLDRSGCVPPDNPLTGIPERGLPFERRWLEGMWERLNAPKVDYWCGNAHWIYTPTEAYIAARRPRLAVTVHDLHAFEENLLWSNMPQNLAWRRRWVGMFRPIIKHADCLLAVSEFTRRRLVELLGADPDRMHGRTLRRGCRGAYGAPGNASHADPGGGKGRAGAYCAGGRLPQCDTTPIRGGATDGACCTAP
jgi:hypothetical protein